jgi:type IV secretion system protein VirB5
MKLRHIAACAAFTSMALCSCPVSAQMAVVDFSVLTQAIKQVSAWAQQAQQMQTQIAAMTGNRGMSALLPAMVPSLPPDWDSAMNTLSAAGQQIRQAQNVLTPGQTMQLTPQLQSLLGQAQTLSAANQAMSQAAFNDATVRQVRLQSLTARLGTTSDPKSDAELANAIGIEQAGLLKDQNQLIAAANSQAAQLQAQQLINNQIRVQTSGTGNFPKIDTSLPR